MTFVVELRDLKKSLPRPVTHFWQQSLGALCALRIRLAFLGLIACAVDGSVTAGGGVLALVCGVLTAAVSATLGLLCDAGSGLSTLFSDQASPLFQIDQRLGLGLGETLFKFDICPNTEPFPVLSGHCLLPLLACALLLFGCGNRRHEPAKAGLRAEASALCSSKKCGA